MMSLTIQDVANVANQRGDIKVAAGLSDNCILVQSPFRSSWNSATRNRARFSGLQKGGGEKCLGVCVVSGVR